MMPVRMMMTQSRIRSVVVGNQSRRKQCLSLNARSTTRIPLGKRALGTVPHDSSNTTLIRRIATSLHSKEQQVVHHESSSTSTSSNPEFWPNNNNNSSSNYITSFAAPQHIQEVGQQQEQQQQQQQLGTDIQEPWRLNLRGGEHDKELLGPRGDWWWTGLNPYKDQVPGLGPDGKLRSLGQHRIDWITRQSVQDYFDNTWALTELLFSGLQGEEAFYRPPYHHLRHPKIFYYGHPAVLHINKLQVAGLLEEPVNPYFEELFEVGVDEMSWDDLSKNDTMWPSVREVHDYRKQVYKVVSDLIAEHLDDLRVDRAHMNHPLWALFMGFEHERIHIETSSVLMRELPLHLLRQPEAWPDIHPSHKSDDAKHKTASPVPGEDFPKNHFVSVEGGPVTIGKPEPYTTYGWDNEYGHREVDHVPSFDAAKFTVSNGEFYEFVAAGGYREQRFWSNEGWRWRRFRNAKWPSFWIPNGPHGSHRYRLRTIFSDIPMQWDWPAIVNVHEARAFMNWKAEKDSIPGLRLQCEAEHMLLREPHHRHDYLRDPKDDPAVAFTGNMLANLEPYPEEEQVREGEKPFANYNIAYGSESAVDAQVENKQGFHDVMGNVWEWAEDDAYPLPGFKVHPYYEDFTTPCHDGKHTMLLGGSFISTGDAGANLHSRFHFRPHFLQHSGFRYVNPKRKENHPGEGLAVHLEDEDSFEVSSSDAPSTPSTTSGSSASSASSGSSVKAADLTIPESEAERNQQTYETKALVNQYLTLHYGQSDNLADETFLPHEGRPEKALQFPQRVAHFNAESRQAVGNAETDARALEIGCATGATSLELAKSHEQGVLGVDLSKAFIDAANGVRDTGKANFAVLIEGYRHSELLTADVDRDMNLSPDIRSRVRFTVGDACNVSPALHNAKFPGPFDSVVMSNVLCRIQNPRACLDQMPGLVKPNGVLTLVTPFSWLPQFTPEPNWLSGSEHDNNNNNNNATSFDEMKSHLEGLGFELITSKSLPLVMREHSRKYQYIVPSASSFVRR